MRTNFIGGFLGFRILNRRISTSGREAAPLATWPMGFRVNPVRDFTASGEIGEKPPRSIAEDVNRIRKEAETPNRLFPDRSAGISRSDYRGGGRSAEASHAGQQSNGAP